MQPNNPLPSQQSAPVVSQSYNTLSQKSSRKRPLILAGVAVLVLVVGGATAYLWKGGYLQRDDSVASAAQVDLSDMGVIPAVVKIKKGQSVTWTNKSSTLHEIAADPFPTKATLSELDSQDALAQGDSFTFTFDKPGTYTYHDQLNPLASKGTVVVEE
jgi:plastocyanin